MSRSAAPMLERALREAAARAGCPITVPASHATGWASATFTGERHMLTLAAAASPALDAWLDALSEAEWKLCGQLVADLCVVARHRTGGELHADVEVLTVEDH